MHVNLYQLKGIIALKAPFFGTKSYCTPEPFTYRITLVMRTTRTARNESFSYSAQDIESHKV